jgi:hypothetical protein
LWRQVWLRLADTGWLGYRHRLQPQGFSAQPAAIQQVVLDLDRLQFLEPSAADWVSHPYRQSDLREYPCIESWAICSGISLSQAEPYRCIQFHRIRRARRKPVQKLVAPIALFPYHTSHFGHWIGEQLGSILWFARDLHVTAGGRRLLVTAPSPQWAELLEALCPPSSLLLLTPQQLLGHNMHCTDALLLPRLSSWQNMTLARDALAPLFDQPASHEKLFLTSLRPSRIANLDAVCACFQAFGYQVLNPTEEPVLPLLQRLRQAGCLWSEQGSMVLNLLLCRSRPYRLFELDPMHARQYSPVLTTLGGSGFNAFQRGLMQPFSCLPTDPSPFLDRTLHPYQRQLTVDLQALEAALSQKLV